MHPSITAAFRRPPHLLTRQAALATGMRAQQVDATVRSGGWLPVRRGVYAEREYVESLVHRSQFQRLHDDAVAMTTRIGHVRSHESAAVVWDMAIPLSKEPVTHITVPLPASYRNAPQRSRFRNGVKHHLAPYGPADRPEVVDGVEVLGRARTAADLAREHGLVIGVCGMDAALRAGLRRSDLAAVPARMKNWPHVTTVRQAVELADPGAETVIETLGRLMVQSLGRGRPQTQFGLSDGRRTAFVDLRLGRHLIECDGQLKYLPSLAPGMAPEEVLWDEKLRQDWLCGFKLGVSRLTWSDVWPFGQTSVLERLDREVADTERRFGTDISDLTPYLVQWRRRAA
jgi:hypothetical protein